MLAVSSVILAAALLTALVLSLTLKPALFKKIMTVCMMVAAAGGLCYYGIGYADVTGDLLLSMIRTPFTVVRMFVGVNDLAAIEGSRAVATQGRIILFWLLHAMAFFSMTSAVMSTLGSEALRYLRFVLSRHGPLTLIYGINDNSTELGRECIAAGDHSVVFVAESATPDVINDLTSAGMSVITGADAVAAGKRLMKKLRMRKRELTVYALDEKMDENLFFALRLKDSLKDAGVPAERTRITLPGAEDILMPMLQVSEESYGFGYVNVFDNASLAARALIRTCPPWETMHFDTNGRITDNFDCIVIGFGRHGQAVLKSLVMNGQFAGSSFHAAVFSPNVSNESGYLEIDSPELLRAYDIERYAADARSTTFFEYISRRLSSLKMIVICTGDPAVNGEISDSLMLFLKRHHAEQTCVVQCDETGVRYQETVAAPIVRTSIYTRALLSAEEADRMAILLNGTYDDTYRSEWEKWVSCDSFSKMSSRASGDFMPAFIRASGADMETLLQGTWQPDAVMQQTLGETEHLRWCAFHYAMGYTPMSTEEFDTNAAEYARCMREGIPCNIKIGKNTYGRRHVCLMPWEDLDELSEREKRMTGRNVDYKQIDINNVLAMPRLLRAEQKKGE